MMERRKLWQIPMQHQLEVIDLALVSNPDKLAVQLREARQVMDMGDLLHSDNTFSRSLQQKLDELFTSSIRIFDQATNSWGLRLLWCGNECASQPNQHIWAFATHPCASESLISHACSCTHCFGVKPGATTEPATEIPPTTEGRAFNESDYRYSSTHSGGLLFSGDNSGPNSASALQ